MKRFVEKCIDLLRGRDQGTVAVTFLLSLPLLLIVIGVFVQYALLINARLTVNRAAAAVARSAITSLPTDPDIEPVDAMANVRRTACITLASLSPAGTSATSEATTVADAFTELGLKLPDRFSERYAYAESASSVDVAILNSQDVPQNVSPDFYYARASSRRVRITLHYDFQLTVPVVRGFIGHAGTIAGMNGRFQSFTSVMDVQLSDGREAPTDTNGEPTDVGGAP